LYFVVGVFVRFSCANFNVKSTHDLVFGGPYIVS
jgi:hypothetical protein